MKRVIYLCMMGVIFTSCKVMREQTVHRDEERAVMVNDSVSRQQYLQVLVTAGTAESMGHNVQVQETITEDKTERTETSPKSPLPWWLPWVVSIIGAALLTYHFKRKL